MNIEQEAQKKAQETMENVEKTYALSLNQVVEVKIGDKEYWKFYDPKSDTIRMIEKGQQDLNEHFKNLQQQLSFAKSDNDMENARKIFDYDEKYNRITITLLPILELKTNFTYHVKGLSEQHKKLVEFLLKNSDNLDIRYFNVEKLIFVNEKQEVLYPAIDTTTGKYVIKKAEVKIYEDKKVQVDKDNYLLDIDTIDFDGLVEGIDINVPNDTPIIIAGEEIDLNTLNNYIQYPELLERQEQQQMITTRRKTIIQRLIEAYQRKLAVKQKQNANVKRLVLTPPNKAAFIDAILVVTIASIVVTLLTILIYFR